MSSETHPEPQENRPAEPFTRGRIQWSRPPQTVFRVGLAPVASNEVGAPRPASDILTGTLVPPATPDPVEAPVLVEQAVPVEESAPIEQPALVEEAVSVEELIPVAEPVLVEEAIPVADLAPEVAIPSAIEPEPEPVASTPEIVIEPQASDFVETVPPLLSSEAQPAADPRSLPSVVVTPAIYATVGAAIQKAAKGDRGLIIAGIAAVLVICGFVWLATLPAPQPIDAAGEPLVPTDAASAPETQAPRESLIR